PVPSFEHHFKSSTVLASPFCFNNHEAYIPLLPSFHRDHWLWRSSHAGGRFSRREMESEVHMRGQRASQ
ncbi:hypothetical protein IAQ61_002833, partial [Plenodomus lingam]|uniref:uncharacterized protein n=1 Tax=Leptosphaeria maculans TaxID=5022 RepID=UPI003332F185